MLISIVTNNEYVCKHFGLTWVSSKRNSSSTTTCRSPPHSNVRSGHQPAQHTTSYAMYVSMDPLLSTYAHGFIHKTYYYRDTPHAAIGARPRASGERVESTEISCTHGRNGIRLQVLQTSFRATLCGGLIPPRILPLPLAGSVPSAAETWAVPWDGTLKPDAASSAYTRSTCPSRSFGYAARCTPGCGDQLGGPAFAREPIC